MTLETIEKANLLLNSINRLERDLEWMKDWGKELENSKDKKFRQTISNGDRVVLESRVSYDYAKQAYDEQLKAMNAEIESLKKQLDEL